MTQFTSNTSACPMKNVTQHKKTYENQKAKII